MSGDADSEIERGSEEAHFATKESNKGAVDAEGNENEDATDAEDSQTNSEPKMREEYMKINHLRAHIGCGHGTCHDPHCKSNSFYSQAFMEWLGQRVAAPDDADAHTGTAEGMNNRKEDGATTRRTYENDMHVAYQVMEHNPKKDDDEVLLDTGANIHLLTLNHARSLFASRRATRMTVTGISGIRERCSSEGELTVLVQDSTGKHLNLSLGTGYAAGTVPKSLISASKLMEVGAILHFEKGRSYVELKNEQRIMLIERRGLFYIPLSKQEEEEPVVGDMASVVAQGSHVDTASYLGFSSCASTELPPDPNGPGDMLQVNSMETTRDPTETMSGEADAAVMVADDKGLTNQGSGEADATAEPESANQGSGEADATAELESANQGSGEADATVDPELEDIKWAHAASNFAPPAEWHSRFAHMLQIQTLTRIHTENMTHKD